eukprot:8516038-Pyramimonas_sp.AAC.1
MEQWLRTPKQPPSTHQMLYTRCCIKLTIHLEENKLPSSALSYSAHGLLAQTPTVEARIIGLYFGEINMLSTSRTAGSSTPMCFTEAALSLDALLAIEELGAAAAAAEFI